MRFAGVVSVIPSVARVTTGSVSVMGGFLVLPAFMMLGCFVVMTSGMAVMFGCLAMMFGSILKSRAGSFSAQRSITGRSVYV